MRSSRPLMRRVVTALLIAVALVVCAAVSVRLLLDSDRLRSIAEGELTRILGQPAAIGDIDISFLPRPRVVGREISVGREGADGAGLQLQRVEVLPVLRSLFTDTIIVRRLLLDGLAVRVVRDAAGRWHVPAAVPADLSGGGSGTALHVLEIRLQNGAVRVIRAAGTAGGPSEVTLHDVAATLKHTPAALAFRWPSL
jgi:uncharacterized protein involved in outer membrane biogenesis